MKLIDLPIALTRQRVPLLEALFDLVRIPSVIDEPKPGAAAGQAPFGLEIDRALHRALEIAAGLGFSTVLEPQGYYGYAEIGSGAEMVAVLGHLDVVPPGSLAEWASGPFDPQVRRGRVYGRGVQDDKGPTLAALFGAAALLKLGVDFPRRLRIIFGTDEENLWRCMKRYLAQEELPSLGFTPDAKFPLIYAEKGLLQAVLDGPPASDVRLHGLEAGGAFNAVPDSAEFAGPGWQQVAAAAQALGFEQEAHPDRVRLLGKAAHAQVAETGTNAVCRLALALYTAGLRSPAVDFLAQVVGQDPYGTPIFGDVQDADSGRLKFNVGRLESGVSGERISLDLRLPVSASKEALVETLTQTASRSGLSYRQHDWLAPIRIPPDHFMIKALMQVYREVTGDLVSVPEASGGATYARAMPNCVAFGAVFPSRPKVEHQPNEHIRLDDLYTAMEIYARAIYALTRG